MYFAILCGAIVAILILAILISFVLLVSASVYDAIADWKKKRNPPVFPPKLIIELKDNGTGKTEKFDIQNTLVLPWPTKEKGDKQ